MDEERATVLTEVGEAGGSLQQGPPFSRHYVSFLFGLIIVLIQYVPCGYLR
jgi:hypothetical protein